MLRISHIISLLLAFGLFSSPVYPQQLVPGIIVDHITSEGKVYIGSPGLCILPDGSYVASHDHFGPGSTENVKGVTAVFLSSDKGRTWEKISMIEGQYWSNLFVHNGELYIMGTSGQYGNLVIRKSNDKGRTWTNPADSRTGLIREGMYHTAPVPVLEYKGRIWRAVESAKADVTDWGKRFGAMVFSASSGADLLNADSWISTNILTYDSSYLDGNFRGWLEGNAVLTPGGEVIDFLRVATAEKGRDLAAIVRISQDGTEATFDRFMDFNGGSKKFAIRYDEKSGRYWTIVNMIAKKYSDRDAGSVRNNLVIQSSPDLENWTVHKILLSHPDVEKHGFQYIEWQFEGKNNIIYLSRTAFDDEAGGAHNYHDANFLTFHRIKNFRNLTKSRVEPF